MKKLIVGNWKMNGTLDMVGAVGDDIISFFQENDDILNHVDVVVCPPFPYLMYFTGMVMDAGNKVMFGAQDCSMHDDGAYTSQVSAAMLEDLMCSYVILGHSERRQGMGESDLDVKVKAEKALQHDLIPIICVGETAEQRAHKQERKIVEEQLLGCLPDHVSGADIVIAYEPVWAIGTGKTATPDDVRDMHAFIRSVLQERLEDSDKVRILYGGSMKPNNAPDLLATENVDGGLIGGASLKATDFVTIVNAVKE